MYQRATDSEQQLILRELHGTSEIRGYHRLRSRRSGSARFLEVDVFLDPETSVERAHNIVRELEDRLARQLPQLISTIHVEPHQPGSREGATPPRDEF